MSDNLSVGQARQQVRKDVSRIVDESRELDFIRKDWKTKVATLTVPRREHVLSDLKPIIGSHTGSIIIGMMIAVPH